MKRNVNRMYNDYTALPMKITRSILVQAEQASVCVLAAATVVPQALATTTTE